MALNNAPIFPQTPNVGWANLTTANATASKHHDATGTLNTDVYVLFTAGASGARVDTITLLPLGTNTASVVNIFINNGSTNATATNNTLYANATLAASTISEVAAQTSVTITMNVAIPAGYRILATLGTTVAAGWHATCQGGNY